MSSHKCPITSSSAFLGFAPLQCIQAALSPSMAEALSPMGRENLAEMFLTDRSRSDRTAPGDGDDPSEGIPAGADSD